MIRISLIAAVAENGIIGGGNKMPWEIKSELQYFLAMTRRKPVIMGRKTFESLGMPLKDRANIIVTRNAGYSPKGIVTAGTLEKALFVAREIAHETGQDEIMIGGGAEIYKLALPLADRLYLTEIHLKPEGDTKFPAFDRKDWAEAAVANGEFLLRELRGANGRWFRSWHESGAPKARHAALAGDHAHLVDAFTRLAELTGQRRWIAEARAVADTMLDHFWDTDNGGLYTIPDDGEALLVRQKDLLDNATPSANSAGAWALYRLAALTGETRYRHHADQILRLLGPLMPQAPSAFSNALTAVAAVTQGMTEILVTGDRPDLVSFLQRLWMPDAVFAWGERYDSPLWADRPDGFAYVCRDHVCELPVSSVDSLDGMLL